MCNAQPKEGNFGIIVCSVKESFNKLKKNALALMDFLFLHIQKLFPNDATLRVLYKINLKFKLAHARRIKMEIDFLIFTLILKNYNKLILIYFFL
jgi:hypothetical protein